MDEKTENTPGCENCPLRKRAEARPRSLVGRLWFWHIKWCPGWKSYQAYLKEKEGA